MLKYALDKLCGLGFEYLVIHCSGSAIGSNTWQHMYVQAQLQGVDADLSIRSRVMILEPLLDLTASAPGGVAVVTLVKGQSKFAVLPPGELPARLPHESTDELKAAEKCALHQIAQATIGCSVLCRSLLMTNRDMQMPNTLRLLIPKLSQMTIGICRLQQLRHGSACASPLSFARYMYCVARGGLHAMSTMCDGAVVKALQNLALVLNKLNHPDLALGYAHAATRIDPTASKARYQAASACLALGSPHAALWYSSGVRSGTFTHA